MNRNKRRFVIYILVVVLCLIGAVNLFLTVVDPWGTLDYIRATRAHLVTMQPHSDGFRFPPDDHDFTTYRARIRRDNYRDVPMSVYADCAITFVGDSFIYGSGVSDWDTFASRIAERFNDVEFRNAGQAGYSVTNVERVLNRLRGTAQGFIYLVYDNDYYPGARSHSTTTPPRRLALSWYLFALMSQNQPPYDANVFEARLQPIVDMENVLLFVFADAPLQATVVQAGGISIPRPTSVISLYDFHPDADGHGQIAASMMPHIKPFIERMCNA